MRESGCGADPVPAIHKNAFKATSENVGQDVELDQRLWSLPLISFPTIVQSQRP